jgi:peptidoglycan/LPS O-acetylase OafA/YrhL
MRLFPQFIFYLILTLMFVLSCHPQSQFLSGLSTPKIILNFFMLPLGFYMYGLFDSQLIPQAWSLGLEAMFYLCIPFILIYRLRWPVFLASAGIFLLARFQIIDQQYFSYRLLPGTLFLFLCGSFLQQNDGKRDMQLLYATYIMALALIVMVIRKESFLVTDYNRQVLIGLAFGLPAVAFLTRIKSGLIDIALGNISYGVFLNHFFFIWLFQYAGIDTSRISYILLLLLCCATLGWVSYYFIERPIIAYRHKLRNKQDIEYGEQPGEFKLTTDQA